MAKPTRRRAGLNPNTIVLIRQIMVGVLVFGFLGGIVMGTWYVTRLPLFTIQSVRAEGGESIDLAAIEQLATEQLAGAYFGLIPRQFTGLYPKTAILEAIATLPRVQSVTVDIISGPQLLLAIEEYQPHALWCADVATSTCVFLSETGYAYATAPGLRGGGLLRYVSLAEPPNVGAQPWSTDDYRTLQTLADTLTDARWPISHVEVDAARDVYLHIVGGGEFKMTLTTPITESVENLLTVVTAEQFSHLAPGNFQYIDLRFGNKVFVNEELVVATSSEAVVAEPGDGTAADIDAASTQSDEAVVTELPPDPEE